MSLTYTNQIETILNGIETLIEDEFDIPVMDEHKGNESFVLQPVSDDLIENLHGGQSRVYSTTIIYTMVKAGHSDTNRNHITNRAERIKRLLFNNSNYSPDGTYKWHDGQINQITYEQDEDNQEINKALIEFSCTKQESI